MILFAFQNMEFGGGAEKNLIEVAMHVAKRQPVGFYIAGGYVDPRMTATGPVFRMPARGRPAGLLLDMLHVGWIILRYRVRLVHAHHRYPAFLVGWMRRLLGVRLITTVHNRFPTRAALSMWGDRALAVSHDIAQWLRDECRTPDAMIRVIHNGIAVPPVFTATQRKAFRAELQLPPSAVVLCAVGRLTPQKNFALLLDALALVKQHDWCLLLVGEGEQLPMLQSRARDLGIEERVHFLGRRSDVPLIMQSSDALVMSSAWEGFPYVVVEALASGLPIVATDVGGVREGVVADHTGLLVPPGEAQALAAAIARIITQPDLRSALALQGRQLFEHEFTEHAMLTALDEEIAAQLDR